MADKKVVGIAENLIRFKTDRESMNRALRDIKKVKEELKSVQGSTQKVKQQTQSATRAAKQRTDQDKDWLTVQRAINKNNKQKIKDEGQLLKHQERKLKLEKEHARVLRQKHIEARKAATAGLTAGAGTNARGTLFADMLRAEDAYNKRRDSILSRRDSQRLDRRIRRQASIDKLHGQALAEDARRTSRAGILSRNSAFRRMDMTNADMFNLSNRFGSAGNSRFAGIAAAFQNGDISARMYRQQVSALRRDLSSAASAQRGFNGTLRDMRSAIIQATASYTAFAAIQGIADVGKNYESRNAGMLVATGNKETAAQNAQYLDYQIRRLGLDYNVASKGYVQLGVAGAGVLNQDQINNTFRGLSELGTAVQLDPMRYEKAILAISQMMNKGQIMAEELKSQLGEQVPGSMEAFRKAAEKFVGKDLDMTGFLKLMKDGKLLAKDILPLAAEEMSKMAKNGDALKYSLNSLNSITQRLKLSFAQWSDSIYQGGLSDALKDLYKTLDDIFWFMKQGDSVIGGFLKGFIGQLKESVAFIFDTLSVIGYLLKYKLGINMSGEWFGQASYWLMLAATFNTIYKTLTLMLTGGLLGKLATLNAAAGAAGATGAAVGAGAAAGVGFIPAVRIAAIEGVALFSLTRAILEGTAVDKASAGFGSWLYDRTHITDPNSKDFGSFSFQKWLTGQNRDLSAYQTSSAVSQMVGGGLVNQGYSYMTQAPVAQEPQKIIVEVKDSELSKIIKIGIDDSMKQTVSSIIPAALQPPSLIVK